MKTAFLIAAIVAAGSGRWVEYEAAREAYERGRTMVVVLGAEWCQPCKAAARELEQLPTGVALTKLDVESSPIAKLFPPPSGLPTIYVYRRGRPPLIYLGNRAREIRLQLEADDAK